MSTVWQHPITDASAWRGADLQDDRTWEYTLSEPQVEELDRALRQVTQRGLQLAEITMAHFPLPACANLIQRIQHDLSWGRGFALLRGFPVEGYPLEAIETLYWGFCSHIGTGISQNSDAGLIHYVTDGYLRPQQGSRGVGSPKATSLHVDLTDCVSLLCVRQAPDDPPSRLASSTTVHNELLKQCPEALETLYKGYHWSRLGEEASGESPVSDYRVPLFSQVDGKVACRYNRFWIRPGMEHVGEPLSEMDNEILDTFDQIAHETRLEFPFHPGDVQFCNNYTVLHGRAAHQEVIEEDRKRLLLRIWMDLPDLPPFADEAIVRYGVVRHGYLGWTAQELLAGRHHSPHARRADGAPLV